MKSIESLKAVGWNLTKVETGVGRWGSNGLPCYFISHHMKMTFIPVLMLPDF